MEHMANNDAKERILNASVQLFSKKGFDATRINEIADAAAVNKALIYYYFKGKEDILDYLIQSFFENVILIAMDFIHANIVQMIDDGLLDILPDRLHFVNKEASQQFIRNTHIYYEKVFDYVLNNKALLRIMMLESLKANSKHQKDLFHLLDFFKGSNDNPIYKTIYDADKDFDYSNEMTLFRFFFSVIPIISFAAYYDDYKNYTALSDEELRLSFLRSCQIVAESLASEGDILLKNKA